jgi:hypothetical protein
MNTFEPGVEGIRHFNSLLEDTVEVGHEEAEAEENPRSAAPKRPTHPSSQSRRTHRSLLLLQPAQNPPYWLGP